MIAFKRIILLTAFILLSTNLFSQDWYARYAAGIQWKPVDKLKMELKPEIHLKSFQEPKELLIDYGLEYDIWEFFELGANVRFSNELKNKGNIYVMRYSGDATFSADINRFEFQIRNRFSNYSEYGEEEDNELVYRFRGRVGYNIPNWKADPEIFVETYFKGPVVYISKMRYGAYIDWKLPYNNRLKFGYFFQDYVQKEKFVNVVDVTWSYRIK